MRRTGNGDVEVVELRILDNPYVGGVTHTIAYNATVWPGRWQGIVNRLSKGSAVMIIGVLYIVAYKDKQKESKTANNVNLMHLGFPVADTEEMNKKRKKVVKTEENFLDDDAVITEPDSGVIEKHNDQENE